MNGVKGIRWIIIAVLTAAVVLAICAPSMLQGILPDEVITAANMDEFPLLNSCGWIARQILEAIRGNQQMTVDIVTKAIGPHFLDELVSLLMVSMLTIPVSMILGFLLYKPLYQGALVKGVLYLSLNLCSVMIAWIIYRQIYFRLLIEGLIQKNITDTVLQQAANYATQFFSALLVGAVTIKIGVALLAAHVVMSKMILPIIGTLVRTLLFAFLTALIMLLQYNPQDWQILLPMMLVTLIVSGLSDGLFGS